MMLSRLFNFAAAQPEEEDLSPEDAAMVKTLHTVRQEFAEEQGCNLVLT